MGVFDPRDVSVSQLAGGIDSAATVHLCHPFGDVTGGTGFADVALKPLWAAIPDCERRVQISLTGADAGGQVWLGQAGHYSGRMEGAFLGMPPSGRLVSLRFHEFYRVEDGQAVEAQVIWDLPDLMLQLGVWPMGPALGATGRVPGPMTQDGLRISGDGAAAMRVVGDMLDHLHLSPQGEEAMQLPRFWHPRCSWYGPGGIGNIRGIRGFRDHHQIPFLDAMPDRRGHVDKGHFFAAGNYVGFTAWPGMSMRVTGGGWLGIAGAGQAITMRSLDFWRVEGDLIRENWVTVDLLHVWDQLGVDVLARMRQLL
ncbi:ester cyclase [Jannaschia sp. 2305UL9-9]|uniref:ester cyclase n=1 Tax=Jannaschia sp. 2305UL9-9 TaxID=3121638 RepID=UPI00352721F3